MKNIFTAFILSLIASHPLYAYTAISTPYVSGHWTTEGSPYLVYNSITVPDSNSLIIDPDVSVIFQGYFTFVINGTLKAEGSDTQPITFTINDTTGWATDNLSGAGSWHGITFNNYFGTLPDSSLLKYCNVSYVKIDSTSNGSGFPNLLCISRDLNVLHCNFTNNKTTVNSTGSLIISQNYNIEFGYCNFNNNFSNITMFSIWPADIYFHDNNIFDNKCGGDLIECFNVNMLFENNTLYNNITLSGYTTLVLHGNNITVRKNKFYSNINNGCGAIFCNDGIIDIVDNYICNNQNTGTGCGAVEGGAIKLNTGSGSSTLYKIRNNIIANNYTPGALMGGGGIQVYFCNAIIANNQIINNYADQGAGIYIFGDSTQVVTVKNNILYGNVNNYAPFSSITSSSSGVLNYDHNWTQHPLYEDVLLLNGGIISGDSSTNIIGTDEPGLISPTLAADVTESALTANFGLLPTSPCINMGDSTGAFTDSIDYAGNPRITGGVIDIGAYEYIHTLQPITVNTIENSELDVFPNPASNGLFIKVSKASGTIEVSDIFGRIIFQNKVVNKFMFYDIHTFTQGVYFAKWNGYVKKIVVN